MFSLSFFHPKINILPTNRKLDYRFLLRNRYQIGCFSLFYDFIIILFIYCYFIIFFIFFFFLGGGDIF